MAILSFKKDIIHTTRENLNKITDAQNDNILRSGCTCSLIQLNEVREWESE